MIFGTILTFFITNKLLLAGAYLLGALCFLFLFLHLQYMFKGDIRKNKKIYFTYFFRLSLIIFLFYVSIKISKEFFILAIVGFIIASFSLMIQGLLIVFRNGGADGRT